MNQAVEAPIEISISRGGAAIFSISGGNALAPLAEAERAVVFQALVEALSLISGITPISLSAAKEVVKYGLFEASEQCPTGRRSGVVVPLKARRGSPIEPSKL